jgi:hypothetical protein
MLYTYFKLLVSKTFQHLRSEVHGNSLQQVQDARDLQLAKFYSSVYSHGYSSWNISMKSALIHLLVLRTSKLNINFATETKNQTLLELTEISRMRIRELNITNKKILPVHQTFSQFNLNNIRKPSRITKQYFLQFIF